MVEKAYKKGMYPVVDDEFLDKFLDPQLSLGSLVGNAAPADARRVLGEKAYPRGCLGRTPCATAKSRYELM